MSSPRLKLPIWVWVFGAGIVVFGVLLAGAIAIYVAVSNTIVTKGAGENVIPIAAALFTLFNGSLAAFNLMLQRFDSAEGRRRLAEMETKEARRREVDELRELIRAFQSCVSKIETTTVGERVFYGTNALVVLKEVSGVKRISNIDEMVKNLEGEPQHEGAVRLLKDLMKIRDLLSEALGEFRKDSNRSSLGVAMLSALSSVERDVLDGTLGQSEIPTPEAALEQRNGDS